MYLLMVVAAAVCFAVGGIYMKFSEGLSQLVPSLLVYLLFVGGASLQTIAMHKAEMGVTYILVLGAEAVFALLLGMIYFKESHSLANFFGIALIVTGIVLAKR